MVYRRAYKFDEKGIKSFNAINLRMNLDICRKSMKLYAMLELKWETDMCGGFTLMGS